MRDYLIRRTDGEWFDLRDSQWAAVIRPNTVAWQPAEGWGHCIKVDEVIISFTDEDPGIHVCVEGELPESLSRQVVDEVLANIEQTTGQRGRIVDLGPA